MRVSLERSSGSILGVPGCWWVMTTKAMPVLGGMGRSRGGLRGRRRGGADADDGEAGGGRPRRCGVGGFGGGLGGGRGGAAFGGEGPARGGGGGLGRPGGGVFSAGITLEGHGKTAARMSRYGNDTPARAVCPARSREMRHAARGARLKRFRRLGASVWPNAADGRAAARRPARVAKRMPGAVRREAEGNTRRQEAGWLRPAGCRQGGGRPRRLLTVAARDGRRRWARAGLDGREARG